MAMVNGVGCSSSESTGGAVGLPSRSDGGVVDETSAGDSSASSCVGLAEKVSDRPECDTCAKAQCCSEILACNASADCIALQECLAPCSASDITCLLLCQAAHPSGEGKLGEVGSCAKVRCKTQCPSDPLPDASILGDAF